MRKLLIYISLILSLSVYSQPGLQVFNDTIVHALVVETDMVHWFDTLEHDFNLNFNNPDLYPEVYRKCNIWWDGVQLNNCGFREKGNASNTIANFGKKKPYKFSFDEFNSQTLDGLKKINLNNFTNDPSLLHDVLCNKLFRDEGLPAPRTTYTKLFVNGEYIGLYVVIENIDKTFLKMHYGSANNDGNLYKTDRGAHMFLNWLGPDKQAYKDQKFKLNTNETADDWSKLINFIDFINNDHSPDFKQKLEAKFDVHHYLKVLAIEKCVRSWDSYWGGGNNYYLYEHPDGMIRWIPWDMNETFQDIKVLSGTSALNGYLIPTPQLEERPLLKRIFEYEDWKDEYLSYSCELINGSFNLNHLGEFALKRHNLIDGAYKSDPYRYNSYEDFNTSLTEENKDEVSLTKSSFVLRLRYPGIFPFIESQQQWVVDQLNGWNKECRIESNGLYNLSVFPNPAHNELFVANDISEFQFAQFLLYDFSGRLCLKTEFEFMTGSSTKLNLSGISGGIYLLIKKSAGGRLGRAKVVIE